MRPDLRFHFRFRSHVVFFNFLVFFAMKSPQKVAKLEPGIVSSIEPRMAIAVREEGTVSWRTF